ncbi:MAG: benenodin family lasso peptide [Sphingomonadaceae bacterium]|nr:benenodin family lasso peptide [Sphingomonadaceae bacterium]
MERDGHQQDLVDLGDARDLTRGMALTGADDGNGTQRKGSGISDED